MAERWLSANYGGGSMFEMHMHDPQAKCALELEKVLLTEAYTAPFRLPLGILHGTEGMESLTASINHCTDN